MAAKEGKDLLLADLVVNTVETEVGHISFEKPVELFAQHNGDLFFRRIIVEQEKIVVEAFQRSV